MLYMKVVKRINFFYKFIYLFIYLFIYGCVGSALLRTAFSSCGERGLLLVAVCGLPTVVASRCGARALGTQASVVVACGLSSCGSWALELRLSSCSARAPLLRDMWDPPRPGLEPMSPALAGSFPTTAPPGKPKRINLESSSQEKKMGFFLFLLFCIYVR